MKIREHWTEDAIQQVMARADAYVRQSGIVAPAKGLVAELVAILGEREQQLTILRQRLAEATSGHNRQRDDFAGLGVEDNRHSDQHEHERKRSH